MCRLPAPRMFSRTFPRTISRTFSRTSIPHTHRREMHDDLCRGGWILPRLRNFREISGRGGFRGGHRGGRRRTLPRMATRSRKRRERNVAVMPPTEHRQASRTATRARDSSRAPTTRKRADETATSRIDVRGGDRGLPRQEAPIVLEADSSAVLNQDAAVILARIIRAHLSRSGQGLSSASSERRNAGRTTRN